MSGDSILAQNASPQEIRSNRFLHTDHLPDKNSLEKWISETFNVEFTWRERQDLRDRIDLIIHGIDDYCGSDEFDLGCRVGYDEGYEEGYDDGVFMTKKKISESLKER